MKHTKHAKLNRPNLGHFCRNEWGILGAPCGRIQKLANTLVEGLAADFKVAYVDADHKSGEEEGEKNLFSLGASMEYTDKITHHRFERVGEMNLHQYRQWFNSQDVVLINGNHFKATSQIVILDPKKKDSLRRKLDRLTNVQLFLTVEEGEGIYDFLQEHLPHSKEIPTLAISQTKEITAFLSAKLKVNQAPLYGLVLAGGKSQRMGKDKGSLDYHGKPQREFLVELLNKNCGKTFISRRKEQVTAFDTQAPVVEDSFLGLGPFGAILSAFRQEPDAAWLVVACDLPFLDAEAIEYLIKNRNTSALATAFHNPATDFPDPLVTIWEPRSYPVLFQYLAQGYSCPRKVLINSNTHVIDLPKANILDNVNTPEEMEQAVRKLSMKG